MLSIHECLRFEMGSLIPLSTHGRRQSCSARSYVSYLPSSPMTRHQFGLQEEKEFQGRQTHVCRASDAGGMRGNKETFLSLEEAGLIELSNLESHERFLCRLTVSSLNLLRIISKQEGVPIEELNAGIICDWFVKDKAKRETDFESATLQW